jgi:NNP family nitrate/nitrite transporter-like MFS transporter
VRAGLDRFGYTVSYRLLFLERVVVAIAGVSFAVGIQHVAQWFDAHEIGTPSP